MNNPKLNIKSLHFKLSFGVAAAALVVMLISSYFFYQRSYQNSFTESEHSINQLLETVSATAAIAAYVGNKELAQEVASGLTKNDTVDSAQIRANNTVLGAYGRPINIGEKNIISLKLKGPFDPDDVVGELIVIPNMPLIAKGASKAATATTFSLATQAAVVALIVLILVYWMMTRPLSHLSGKLHSITPGDGQRLDVAVRHHTDEIGLLVNDINSLLDTVEKKLAEERQLRHRVEILEHRFRGIFEDSSAGIFLVRENGTLVTANPAFFKLTGQYSDAQHVPPETNIIKDIFVEPDQARSLVKLALVSLRPCSCDLLIASENGEERWAHCIFSPVSDGQQTPTVEGVMYDITQRKFSEERTRELAEKDGLTGLSNRQAADTALKELTLSSDATTNAAGFVVMLIDLDRFKSINDTYGHDAGDLVLKVVAERLRKHIRTTDIAARLGGDEFLIILTQTENLDRAKEITKNILNEQLKKIEVQPGAYEVIGMSIGIAVFNKMEDDELSVRKHADQAMYSVKHKGRNGYAIYNSAGVHEIYTN